MHEDICTALSSVDAVPLDEWAATPILTRHNSLHTIASCSLARLQRDGELSAIQLLADCISVAGFSAFTQFLFAEFSHVELSPNLLPFLLALNISFFIL